MTNKVGITVAATADTSQVEQAINALGQRIAQSNRVQFTPVSAKSIDDVRRMNAALAEVMRTQAGLRQRLNATGQTGTAFTDWDWQRLYPHAASRGVAMQSTFERVVGPGRFTAPPPPPVQPPGAPPPGGVGGGGGPGMGTRIVQAGLSAAGPAGGVAAGAIGTGMSAGFGAGLMGLLGGMLALGVGKIVSSAMEKISQAEDNSVALDKLKRTLGDVNVSFEALKSVVHGGADNLKITYAEAGQLSQQFVKLGNVTTEQYKTIGDELGIGVGMSRSFGLDPSQGVGVMGQMRGLGITTNTQESRRFALLIGETIGKSGAFAKADEVMDALASYTASQTRNSLGVANAAGFAGLLSSMVGSGIPGLDPQGAAGLIARINASLAGGGSKGEASQFFTNMVGSDMGLDPIQTQIMREGGAFATNSSMFGKDSAARRYGISGPAGDQTFLQATIARLRRQYGGNKGLLAQAAANHLGIGINQAMSLLSLKPNEMGEMQDKFGDLSKYSVTGIGNISKALYGGAEDVAALRSSYLGRKDVSDEDKRLINQTAVGSAGEREVLAKLAAQYEQERTTGSDIRDSKNLLDNLKTNIADKLVPIAQATRDGILFMAGGGKKSRLEVLKDIEQIESDSRIRSLEGQFKSDLKYGAARDARLKYQKENQPTLFNPKTPEETEAYRKKMKELMAAEEAARAADIRALEEHTKAVKRERELRDENIKKLEASHAAEVAVPITNQSEAETARLGRVSAPAGSPVTGGRRYTTGGVRMTSGFGMRVHPITGQLRHHNGVDFAAPEGTPIQATADGEVVRSGMSRGGYGNVVEVRHADGSVTRYAHNKSNSVKVGQQVKAGDIVGKVGSTGRSTGPHLHYELLKEGAAVDPTAAFASGEHRRPLAVTPRPDPVGAASAAPAAAGGAPAEMSVRLDLTPEARRLLKVPDAPTTGRVSPPTPFGG